MAKSKRVKLTQPTTENSPGKSDPESSMQATAQEEMIEHPFQPSALKNLTLTASKETVDPTTVLKTETADATPPSE